MSSRRGGTGRGYGSSSGTAPATNFRRPRGNGGRQPVNRGFDNNRGQSSVINPPLERGWSRGPDLLQSFRDALPKEEDMSSYSPPAGLNDESDDDSYHDSDDSDEEYDSDERQKSRETIKNSKHFKAFFDLLDSLSVEQINDPTKGWHCAACQNGPGAVAWYYGLQALLNHAKTKRPPRMKLHRELASLLDEDIQQRGISCRPPAEICGKWEGLGEEGVNDKEIVWPPMVIIMNTLLEQGEDDKWRGMGNEELRSCFKSDKVMKVRHSYGPQGHRGMSMLIFEASAVGFIEAERLSKNFEEQRRDRDAWNRYPMKFLPGGKRQLYGYMADKRDLELFDRHSPGKSKLKFEMRSYEEMVVSQLKKMDEDNQHLLWCQNKLAKERTHSQSLAETLRIVTNQLRKNSEESRILRIKSKNHHEQLKEELEYLEKFYQERNRLYIAQEEKEDNFEKVQQQECEKVKQYLEDTSSTEDQQTRLEKAKEFIEHQEQGMNEFAEERDRLQKEKEEKKNELTKWYVQEGLAIEKEYDAKLTQLMDNYTPK